MLGTLFCDIHDPVRPRNVRHLEKTGVFFFILPDADVGWRVCPYGVPAYTGK